MPRRKGRVWFFSKGKEGEMLAKVKPLRGITTPEEAVISKEDLKDLLDIEPTIVSKFWRLAASIVSELELSAREKGEAELKMVEEFLNSSKTFYSTLTQMAFDAFWSGSGWAYLVSNATGDAYIDLIRIDPLRIDVKRKDGRAILDDKGNPKALVLTIYDEQGREVEVEVSPNEYFQLKFINVAYDPLGRSLLEAAYNTIVIKANVELNLGQCIDIAAKRPVIIKVGSKDTQPWTPGNVKKLYQDFSKPYDLTHAVVPWDVEIKPLETPPIMDISGSLDYFERLLNDMLFMPAIAGRGRRVDALEAIEQGWEDIQDSFRTLLGEQVESNLFTKIVAKRGGDPDLVPKARFKPRNPAIALSKARRLAILARAGLITWSPELENRLRALEGLPPLSEEEAKRVERSKPKEEPEEEV